MITLVRNNRTGKPESTERAIKHKEDGHSCISCGCAMRIYRSSAGNACARVAIHRTHEKGCACITHQEDKRAIDITRTDLQRIDKCIMSPPNEGTGGEGGGPGKPRTGNERVSEIKSLKDMYVMGLCSVKDFALNENVWLHQILLNRHTVYTVLNDNEDVGNRAVLARPSGVNWDTLSIHFWIGTILKKVDEEQKVSKMLVLQFDNENEFKKQVNRLFSKNEGYGYASKYDRVLIYGHNWTAKEQTDCKTWCKNSTCTGDWVCSGLQYTECRYPSHQIYLPKAHKITKSKSGPKSK